jgi:hypothetical protein
MQPRLVFSLWLPLALPAAASACAACRPAVTARVLDDSFAATLGWILLPVFLIAAIAALASIPWEKT